MKLFRTSSSLLSELLHAHRWATLVACIVTVVGAAQLTATTSAIAADPAAAARVARLNRLALDAFDNLNFEQAKTLLEQALAESETANLTNDPATARTHLNLGMVFIAGFQQREQASEHFKGALKINPDIAAPAGLFNPEVQAVFDEVKARMSASKANAGDAEGEPSATPRPTRPAPAAAVSAGTADESESEEEEEEETAEAGSPSKYLLSVGLGSGFGTARGTLDTNRDLDSNGDGIADNKWSGGLSPSRLGHVVVQAGTFVLPNLLLSLEGRLQVVSGTTVVKGAPGTQVCVPDCSAPSTALAVMAKAAWFFSPGPLRPFVSGGLGAGSIRQVVKLNVAQPAGQPATTTGCGDSRTETCVDTVTGGPFWLAAGGGVAYEIGSLMLLGSLTANVGIPKFMFNIDALLAVGLRL